MSMFAFQVPCLLYVACSTFKRQLEAEMSCKMRRTEGKNRPTTG